MPVRALVMAFQIDHLITVTTDREAARTALAEMGFELSSRGEHPGRGTSNHLMFFEQCYWELLSVDEPGPANSMLLGTSSTLVACALRTRDAAGDAAAAARLGAEPGPLESITRPVRVGSEWHVARFTIAALKVPAADVHLFFCQHLTPELVWPRRKGEHPNGAFRVKALQVVGTTRESAHSALGPLLGAGGDGEPCIDYLSSAEYGARFAGSPPALAVQRPRLASLTLQVRDLEACAGYLTRHHVPNRRSADEIEVNNPIVGHPIAFAR